MAIKRLYKKLNIFLLGLFLKKSKKIIDHYGLNDHDIGRTLIKSDSNISRVSDYSSPLPLNTMLKLTQNRWDKASEMRGISFDLDSLKINLSDISVFFEDFYNEHSFSNIIKNGYGPGYTETDALCAYSIIRRFKPKRYIEVGSGVSTFYANAAVAKEKCETLITCIEPYPYDALYKIPNIKVIKSELQDVELSLFDTLEKNDILFIDSSHIVRIDGDVPLIVLEILPRLKEGVIIHIHDVPFPFNTPFPSSHWIFRQPWPVYWNEAMLVQAFLSFNNNYRIYQSLPILRYYDENHLKSLIKNYRSVSEESNTFSSLWIIKEKM